MPEAEPGLEREAAVLRRLGEERPTWPASRACSARAAGRPPGGGREAVEGEPLLDALTPANFEELATRVTRLLIELAGTAEPVPPTVVGRGWSRSRWPSFERHFGAVVAAGALSAARADSSPASAICRSSRAPRLLALEHRPRPPAEPGLLDWESAEPDGLPGLDLVYFLANCAFVLDGALEPAAPARPTRACSTRRRRYGRVAARRERRVRAPRSASPPRTSAACACSAGSSTAAPTTATSSWSRRRTPRPEALREAMFLGLVEEELARFLP